MLPSLDECLEQLIKKNDGHSVACNTTTLELFNHLHPLLAARTSFGWTHSTDKDRRVLSFSVGWAEVLNIVIDTDGMICALWTFAVSSADSYFNWSAKAIITSYNIVTLDIFLTDYLASAVEQCMDAATLVPFLQQFSIFHSKVLQDKALIEGKVMALERTVERLANAMKNMAIAVTNV